MMTVCDPDWIQTNDLLLRRQLLYSTELPDQNISTNDLPDLKSGVFYSTELPDFISAVKAEEAQR